MSPQAQIVIFAWLPIILLLFNQFPPRTAIIISFIGGILFLPQGAGLRLPLIPDYTGDLATCYGITLGICLFDFQRLYRFRGGWVDLPMLIWCICPLFSSLTNGLGWYDGLNESIKQAAMWGWPYFIGRLYLSNLAGLKELAIAIVKGGLIYIPFCLWEARMSPHLHHMVYGYYAHSSGIIQAVRDGGWRPMVFMEHGLVVALWMMTAALIALWLWKANTLETIWDFPFLWAVVALVITTIIIRSAGAYVYLAYGAIVLAGAKWKRLRLPLLLLILGIILYLVLAASGIFKGDEIVTWAANYFNPERADSLAFRFKNETLLGAKAREKLIFGWGGWGRSRIIEENWEGELVDITVTDSLWIIAFGINGLVGLISLTASMLLPVICFGWFSYPVKTWFNAKVAPAAALSVVLSLYMLNCSINGHYVPIYPMIGGGLSGLFLSKEHLSLTSAAKSKPKPKPSTGQSRHKRRKLSPTNRLF
ncbi:MAG: O-antigen ligase domain-containing protein [Hydrococcus sp. Prado102]|jgi:hypothetical protein|nr:O-antigen ligase domain-containing protein [Hydrococcus sp. Prado102]